MAKQNIDRKIAVIFATDVVGYSKHMESNESETIHNLRECESILTELLSKYDVFPEKMNEAFPFLFKGPSVKIFDPNVFADNFPENDFLFPSMVLISIIDETLPPYSALKAPV